MRSSRRLALLFVFAFSGVVARDARAEPDAPAPRTRKVVERERPDASTTSTVAGRSLDLAIGFDILSRRLRFEDDYYGFLRPYDLPAGPSVSIDARFFPGAFRGGALASAFGIEFRFDRSFAIESERSGLLRFPTANRIVEANLLGRAAWGRAEILGTFGYGHHIYVLDNAQPTTPGLVAVPEVPDVRYSYLRIGAESRVDVHRFFALSGGLSYLVILDAGPIGSEAWFPRSEAGGVAGFARAIVPLARGLEARAGVELRRYFFTMNPEVGDPFIAGGALDRYVLVDFALAYRY